MSTILEFKPVKHIYETDNCAGCEEEIEDWHTEVVMDMGDHKKHIVLCPSCNKTAKGYGVL